MKSPTDTTIRSVRNEDHILRFYRTVYHRQGLQNTTDRSPEAS